MADKINQVSPENAYEAAILAQQRLIDRGKKGRIVVRDEERPWETTRQGRLRFFLHPDMYPDTVLQEWRVFSQEIRTKSGKHRHQGGIIIYVIEGKGYSMVEDERIDWEKGDLLLLPMKPGGVEHQHFNLQPGKPAFWAAFISIPIIEHLASEMTQTEESPEFQN